MNANLCLALLGSLLLSGGLRGGPALGATSNVVDVVVAGAGISGLAAALEGGRAGAQVSVVDMWSVFGGHAVMSGGAVCLVDTPFQREYHIIDSPELAIGDFLTHGVDCNPDWVRLYARSSRPEVYDWLQSLGVRWTQFNPRMPGNRVRRQHIAKGRGLGLVSPIYQECLRWPNIRFIWNSKVTSLLVEDGQVRGIRVLDLRRGESYGLRSAAVVLATGGFESNLEMVRQHWPATFPELDAGAKVLLGSGVNSVGSGLEVARTGGAALSRLDHQLFYATGLVDPHDPGKKRGLNSSTVDSIWLNAQGHRFVREMVGGIPDLSGTVPAVMRQTGASYWSVFDATGRAGFFVSGSGWDRDEAIEREIFANPGMRQWVKRADTLEGLAGDAGLPPEAVVQSVRRWNEMVAAGEDTEWQRFGRMDANRPHAIQTPPFFAVRYFTLARKSMGGVAVDLSCRVLDRSEQAIPNLYAVGELAGVGGINGRAALEGTMLGPGLLMGRIAARGIVEGLRTRGKLSADAQPRSLPEGLLAFKPGASDPLRLWHEDMRSLVGLRRQGYLHFEKVHSLVLDRQLDCRGCHSEPSPTTLTAERLDRHALIKACVVCHGLIGE